MKESLPKLNTYTISTFHSRKMSMADRKYKLLSKRETVEVTNRDGSKTTISDLRRIQALRDIPRHNVKAGDIGGWVSHRKALSHEGDCWVGGNAVVVHGKQQLRSYEETALNYSSEPIICGNALITDNSMISNSCIEADAVVRGNSQIHLSNITGPVEISGESDIRVSDIKASKPSCISGHSIINRSLVMGEFAMSDNIFIESKSIINGVNTIKDRAILHGASIIGTYTIKDSAQAFDEVNLRGTGIISGSAIVPDGFRATDLTISQGIATYESINNALGINPSSENKTGMDLYTPSGNNATNPEKSSISSKKLKTITRVESNYQSYVNDIVKLIRYPAMSDASIPEVRNFILALNRAKADIEDEDYSELSDHAQAVEEAFIIAESKVMTLSQSHLDENKKKSLKTAQKMFAIAENDGAAENERSVSFKAGFKELEGVLPLTDELISAFKVKTGLLELEA